MFPVGITVLIGVGAFQKVIPNIIKTENKKKSDIHSVFNKFLLPGAKSYEKHAYLSKHFKPDSCMLTAIIEQYYEPFRKRKSDGKRMFKEDITYEYLCDLFNLVYAET